MGRAARDSAGRVAASAGAMAEAQPRFDEPLSAVACGGVLAALPALLEEGLLQHADRFLSLPKGYYGLTSTLLLLAFLFLARVRNPEALRQEWGAVLGLDRCPEAKTLRRKVRALAADERRVKGWHALARDWMADGGDTVATLAVDGHEGLDGTASEALRVAAEALPARLDETGSTRSAAGRSCACTRISTPAWPGRWSRRAAGAGTDRPAGTGFTASEDATPALTLVFDREGWSPALFKRLARRGVAVITWHKGFRGEDWPEEEFRAVAAPLHGPGGVQSAEVRLAERRIRLRDGPEVRQIRRLLDTGRQVPLVTTDFGVPMEQAAGALFSRWAQESFFKYMREEFNLDGLPVHGLAGLDPDARVDPARRELDRRINRMRSRLGTLRKSPTCSGARPPTRPPGRPKGSRPRSGRSTPSARRSSCSAGRCPRMSGPRNSARTRCSTRCPPARGCSST